MKCISMNSDGQSIITVELINKRGIDEICNMELYCHSDFYYYRNYFKV